MADVNDVKKNRCKESKNSTLPPSSGNKFSNDGSFMEMFKKQMEEKRRQDESGKQQLKYTESPKSATSSLTATPNESHSTEKLQASSSSESTNKRTLTHEKKLNYSFFVGKRRGSAPVLKTGAVKKAKVKEEDEAAVKTDAWSQYLAEVQKYKSRSCQDEDRTRPLVK